MRLLIVWCGVMLCLCLSASAQTLSDALLWSNSRLSNTPRATAIGNAMAAIGGDLSNLQTNAAGLGLAERSFVQLYGNVYLNQQGEQVMTSVYNGFGGSWGTGGVLVLEPTKKEGSSARPKWVIGMSYQMGPLFSGQTSDRNGYGEVDSDLSLRNHLGVNIIQYLGDQSNGIAEEELSSPTVVSMLVSGKLESDGQGQYTVTDGYRSSGSTRYRYNKYGLEQQVRLGASLQQGRWHWGAALHLPILNYAVSESVSYLNDSSNRVGHATDRGVQGIGLGLSISGLYQYKKRFTFGGRLALPTVVSVQEEHFRYVSVENRVRYGLLGATSLTGSMGMRLGAEKRISIGAQAGFTTSVTSVYFGEGLGNGMAYANRGMARTPLWMPILRIGAELGTKKGSFLRIGAAPFEGNYSFGMGGKSKMLTFDWGIQYSRVVDRWSIFENAIWLIGRAHHFHVYAGLQVHFAKQDI